MDAVDVGRVMAVLFSTVAIALLIVTARAGVTTWGEVMMGLIYMLDLWAFSVYSFLANVLGVIGNLPNDLSVLWSSIERQHASIMVASYCILLIVRACRMSQHTWRDVLRTMWRR